MLGTVPAFAAEPAAESPDSRWVNNVFQRGKDYYEKGNYNAALQEWDKLNPYLDQYPSFKNVVGYLRAQVASGSRSAAKPQPSIRTTLQKGRVAYENGNWAAALAEWKKIEPQLDPKSEEYALLQKLKKDHETANVFRKQSRTVEETVEVRAPDELTIALKQASQKLQEEIFEIQSRKENVEKEAVFEQAWIDNAFARGRDAYEAGDRETAMEEWSKIAKKTRDEALAAQIEELRTAYRSFRQQELAYIEADQARAAANPSWAEMKRVFSQAAGELKDKARLAASEGDERKRTAEQEQRRVTDAFEKGRSLYHKGEVRAALEEWSRLEPFFESDPVIKSAFMNVQVNMRAYDEAVEARGGSDPYKLKLPPDFFRYVEDASRDMLQQKRQAEAELKKAEEAAGSKRAQVRQSFEKGQALYGQGRVPEAVAEWKKNVEWVEDGEGLLKELDQLEIQYREVSRQTRALSDAQAKAAEVLPVPAETTQLLAGAADDMRARADAAADERRVLEQSLNDRRAKVSNILYKASLAHKAGKTEQAVEEWKKLGPYLDPLSEEAALIERLDASRSEYLKALVDLKQTPREKDLKTELPPDMKKLLVDTEKQLSEKTAEMIEKKQSASTRYVERETEVLSAIERSKIFLQAGRAEEALAELKKVSDRIDDRSGSRAQVQALEAAVLNYRLAEQGYEQAASKVSEKFATPEELAAMIETASEQLAAQTQEAAAKRAELEQEAAERRAKADLLFQSGKDAFAKNEWRRALDEWQKLAPQLEDPAISTRIEAAKAAFDELHKTKSANEAFIASEYRGRKQPFAGELEKMLSKLDADVSSSLAKVHAERGRLEQSVAERDARVKAAYEKGKAFYEAGKLREAVEAWSDLKPHLKDELNVQALLAALPDRYAAFAEAERSAAEAEKALTAPLDPPAGFVEHLTAISERLSASSLDAMTRAEASRAASEERIASMNQLYMQGKEAADKNQWEQAIKTWSGLLPHMKDQPRLAAALDNLTASYRNYAKTLNDAQQAKARLDGKLPVPEELAALLADASFKLDKERQTAELGRERTDKIFAEKQAAVEKLYAEGKAFHDQGKLADAFAAWRSMLPSVTGEKELAALIDKADQSYQSFLAAKEQSQQSLAKREMKLDPPADLAPTLETANQQLRDQIFDLKNRSSQTQKMIDDRRQWVDVTFEKGKLAYSQGRYRDAAAEWKTLLPFIENGERLEQLIADFERNLDVSIEASKSNAEADIKRTAKFPAPDELGVLLMELNEKVRNEALEAGAEKVRAEQQYSERQKWMSETFERGKELYLKGQYDSAIAEWEKLTPYLEEQSGAEKLLEAVKQSHRESLMAKKAAVEAAAGDYQGLKLPYAEQMTQLLRDAGEKLAEEAAGYQAKREGLEKTLAERQEWSVTTFNRGKVFYDQGKYDEALDQWERLLPYLAEGSEAKERIAAMRKSMDTIEAGRTGEGKEPPVRLKNEQEMLEVLEDAAQTLKERASETEQKRLEAQKTFEQRQQWVQHTFDRGRAFFNEGRYDKAVQEWGVLGPYLSEYPAIRDMIEAAKKEHSEGRDAERIIETLEAKKQALLPLPSKSEENIPQETAPEEGPGLVPPTPQRVPDTESEDSIPSEEPAQESAAGETAAEPVPASVQLVSGEVVSLDEPSRSLTLKLYTETGAEEELTVHFDDRTEVGGGKSLSALPNGAAIDVRYNPETSLAQYIYVY